MHLNRIIRFCLLTFLLFAVVSCDKTPNPTPDDGKGQNEKPTTPTTPTTPKTPEEQAFIRRFSTKLYTEYRTGNYPLIITVPHGGKETSKTITVRTATNCPDPNFTTVLDTNTPELANAIDEAVFALTGKRPYYIEMKLKRTYLDVNRKKEYSRASGATEEEAEEIWDNFYKTIADAKKEIVEQYGAGLLIDIHAHGHAKQEVEIGYQISTKNLNKSDEELNSSGLEKSTGIYNLIKKNKQKVTFADHIRGKFSFGTLLNDFGTPCIPHSTNKFPGDDGYLSGGNITKANGSGTSGSIDAIQLEFNRDCKKDNDTRKETAQDIAQTVQKYLELHYDLMKKP